MKNDKFKILTSPFFLLGLGILLINDFYLKQYFGNWWTGKLSDLSGLFIFPLFLTALFPKRKEMNFIATAILFTLWKLPIFNPIIDFANSLSIPIERTIDWTDLLTLSILPLAYFYEKSNYKSFRLKPQLLILISTFAFVATTIPPKEERKYVNINKTYEFNFSRNELIDKLNRITAKKISKEPKQSEIKFDSDNDTFYYTKWNKDTIAVLLDSRKIGLNDTLRYETVLADFIIKGSDSISSLTFVNAYKVVPKFSDKEYREKAIKEFERKVIRKLK